MKPKLLFLSQTLPFPPTGGVKIRTFNTLRILAEEYDVTALCFYRWKRGRLEPDVDSAVENLREYATVFAFPISSEHAKWRLFWDHLRSVIRGRVYTRFIYESKAFRRRLSASLERHTFELIHADSLDLSGYFDHFAIDQPLVCVHHDAQSLLLQRRSERVESVLLRLYLRFQANLMRREEQRGCERASLNIAVSEADQKVLNEIVPSASFAVIPNGVDVQYFQPQESRVSGLCFVGGTTWFPNRDALRYFRSSVLPLLNDRLPGIETTWVGRISESEKREYASVPGLTLTGFVPDVRPYLASAECVIVPLRVGGGTRIKILDAWAMGKAVVSTSVGCEGLDARDEENILIADGPASFAEAVARVTGDPRLRKRLERNGRDTVLKSYSWDVVGRAMLKEYHALTAEGSRRGSRAGERS